MVPYLIVLYLATARYGVVGAAVAWSIRAAFDLILFRFTNPRRTDLRTVALSGALVAASMGISLGLSWQAPAYWAAMTALVLAACYQNRAILTSAMLKFKAAASTLAG